MKFENIVLGISCIVALIALVAAPAAGKLPPDGPGFDEPGMDIHPNITEGGCTIPIDGYPSENYSIRVYNIKDKTSDHIIKAITLNATNGSTEDLQYKFYNASDNSIWLNSGETWNWGAPSGSEYTLILKVKIKSHPGPTNAVYIFQILDSEGATDISSIHQYSLSNWISVINRVFNVLQEAKRLKVKFFISFYFFTFF